MKVCVLQPDYSPSGVDYQNYDPPRNLAPLLPGAQVDHVFLNKLTTYKQLRELKKKKYDIYVNLCEGYLEWEVPSVDVIHSFELLDLPYTGPSPKHYDIPKELMKYVAYCEGVKTPGYFIIDELADVDKVEKHLSYPMFVKPAKAGDSLGVDERSLVRNRAELDRKVAAIFEEYGPLLVEEYIAGREFTVLVAANPDGKGCTTYKPVEYRFPAGLEFKTYALKTSELHPDCNFPVEDPLLEEKLRKTAERMFLGANGMGYARLDMRMNEDGDIYFLEMNFTCSVFYTDGYEGSADFALKFDKAGQAGFLKHIIEEGLARFRRKKNPYVMRGNAIAGYGIYANRDIREGEVVYRGEEKAQRLVTKRYVETHWSEADKLNFRRYAYAVSEEVFILWDEDPAEWAPENHSCEANTGVDGLNIVALREIKKGEELTLDYAVFLDETMEPFVCKCGAKTCRGKITGVSGNSTTHREQKLLVVAGR